MDTRNKRASALGFALAALVVLPAPDGTIAQADRQQVTMAYAGIAAGTPQVDSATTLTIADAAVTTLTVADAAVTALTITDAAVTSLTSADALAEEA